MLNLWFVRSSAVSLADQIVTQVRMAVLAGDLRPGDRLPSVRVLARRFHLHPNTASTACRRLRAQGLVTMRPGSGVYVREALKERPPGDGGPVESQGIEQLVGQLVRSARIAGLTPEQLAERVVASARGTQVSELLVVEPDRELRRIVETELRFAVPVPVRSAARLPLASQDDRLVVILPGYAARARLDLAGSVPFLPLRVRSAGQSMAAHLPGSKTDLVALVSHCARFLEIGRTMLLAAGLEPEALLVRDAREAGWGAGLDEARVVVCDTFTGTCMPSTVQPVVFPLVAEASIEELRARTSAADVL